MPAKKKRARAPGLYVTDPDRPAPRTAADLIALLHREARTPTLERNLAHVDRMADQAERDGLADHAASIRKHRKALDANRKAGRLDAAILEAMSLGAAFERLRADALLAGPVDSYKRGRPKPVTSDAAIIARMAARKPGERLADVAASLRMSERQLRDRRKRIEQNRKSVRPPPPK